MSKTNNPNIYKKWKNAENKLLRHREIIDQLKAREKIYMICLMIMVPLGILGWIF